MQLQFLIQAVLRIQKILREIGTTMDFVSKNNFNFFPVDCVRDYPIISISVSKGARHILVHH